MTTADDLMIAAVQVTGLGELRIVRLNGGGYDDAQIVRMVDGRAAEPLSVPIGTLPPGTAEKVIATLAAAPLLAAAIVTIIPELRAWHAAIRAKHDCIAANENPSRLTAAARMAMQRAVGAEFALVEFLDKLLPPPAEVQA